MQVAPFFWIIVRKVDTQRGGRRLWDKFAKDDACEHLIAGEGAEAGLSRYLAVRRAHGDHSLFNEIGAAVSFAINLNLYWVASLPRFRRLRIQEMSL